MKNPHGNPREAAYIALLEAWRDGKYLEESLEEWRLRRDPPRIDFHLAQQIAFGTMQRTLTLNDVAIRLSSRNKSSLKLKERVLLQLTLFQALFLDRIPAYAILDESMKLAGKYCHSRFTAYLNGIVRRLFREGVPLPMPPLSKEGAEGLSIRHSYPPYFIEQLLIHYGTEATVSILEAGNCAAPVMARIRSCGENPLLPGLELIQKTPCTMAALLLPEELPAVAASTNYYIQNITPATLIAQLAASAPRFKRILDMCASPGGKLLAVHDQFPDAELHANEISEKRLTLLRKNCDKYGVQAKLSCHLGEAFPADKGFDLIILDVPCSNTGVLNKRPEARWRIDPPHLAQLQELQWKLLSHASTLLNPGGEVWYMTCSILPSENETMVSNAVKSLGLEVREQQRYLPNSAGWDGGFAAALKKI